MTRTHWLASALVALFLIVCISWWIQGWGLITLEGKDLNLADVLKSVSRQSGAKVITNMDPQTKVSVEFHRTPLAEALEVLSVRTDSRWEAVWVAAPDKTAIVAAANQLQESGRPKGWQVYTYPAMGMDLGEPVDPRKIKVELSATDSTDLASAFDQLAQKTGVRFMLPEDWKPTVDKSRSATLLTKLVPSLVKQAKGTTEQLFLLASFRQNRPQEQQAGPPQDGGQWMGGGGAGRGGRNRQINPQWMDERLDIATANLPPDEKAATKATFQEMRQLFASLRDLPQEERRAKMEEFMNRPDVMDRMDQAQANRDARNTPERRIERYRKYVQRKEKVKGGPQ